MLAIDYPLVSQLDVLVLNMSSITISGKTSTVLASKLIWRCNMHRFV